MVHKTSNSDKLFNLHVQIKLPAEDNNKLKY